MKDLFKNKWFWGIIILVIILGIIACKNGVFATWMQDGGMAGDGRGGRGRGWWRFPFFRRAVIVRPTYTYPISQRIACYDGRGLTHPIPSNIPCIGTSNGGCPNGTACLNFLD